MYYREARRLQLVPWERYPSPPGAASEDDSRPEATSQMCQGIRLGNVSSALMKKGHLLI